MAERRGIDTSACPDRNLCRFDDILVDLERPFGVLVLDRDALAAELLEAVASHMCSLWSLVQGLPEVVAPGDGDLRAFSAEDLARGLMGLA